jgi:hypothetical protein
MLPTNPLINYLNGYRLANYVSSESVRMLPLRVSGIIKVIKSLQ